MPELVEKKEHPAAAVQRPSSAGHGRARRRRLCRRKAAAGAAARLAFYARGGAMRKRCYIPLGAATDAGGKVVTASSSVSLDGIPRALEGDLVDCPNCQSKGKIA